MLEQRCALGDNTPSILLSFHRNLDVPHTNVHEIVHIASILASVQLLTPCTATLTATNRCIAEYYKELGTLTEASCSGDRFLSFQGDDNLREQNKAAADLFMFLKNQQPVGKQKSLKNDKINCQATNFLWLCPQNKSKLIKVYSNTIVGNFTQNHYTKVVAMVHI